MEITKQELLFKLLRLIHFNVTKIEDIHNIDIDQNTLKDFNIVEDYYKMMPELKTHYNSEYLTCLHKNSLKKQRFPAVNMLRQILKCNNLKLKPYVVCRGYDKGSGRKLVDRYYTIIPLN